MLLRAQQFRMQVDETKYVGLHWCPLRQQYQATHLLLGVPTWLRKSDEPYTLGFDADGSAFFSSGADSLWASEVFGGTAVQADNGDVYFLAADGSDPTSLQAHRASRVSKYVHKTTFAILSAKQHQPCSSIGYKVYWCMCVRSHLRL